MLFQEDQVAFCERCFHSTPCWCCHLPCGPLHRRLSDERIVCQHCYGTALLSPWQVGTLYESTIRFFQKQMKMRLKKWTAYKLAEHHELYRAMLSMRRNVAEPYHTGLHTLLALEQKLGVQRVIQFAKTETSWN